MLTPTTNQRALFNLVLKRLQQKGTHRVDGGAAAQLTGTTEKRVPEFIGLDQDLIRMVRQPMPEQQTLMSNSIDRRRSTRIPLDNRNSRILRQSLANYQGQPTSLQDELAAIEKAIEELRSYNDGVPSSLPIEDEQMHAMEGFMKSVGCSACRIRSQLRHMEPRCESTSSVEAPRSTVERRGSYYNTRYTQYHSQASTFYSSLETYKGAIESYYHKLVSSTQHRPMSYWAVAEDNAEPVYALLTESSDMFSSALNVKQRLSVQLQEISEREKRIREWHKLLSTTFQPKVESDDDCSSASSPPSYDTEAALVVANDYKDPYNHSEHTKNRRFSRKRLGLAFLLTVGVVVLLLGAIALILFFYGGFMDTQQMNTTSTDTKLLNESTDSLTTVHMIQAVMTKTANATTKTTAATTFAPTGKHSAFAKTNTQVTPPTSLGATVSKTPNASTTPTPPSATVESVRLTTTTTSDTLNMRRNSTNTTMPMAVSQRPALLAEPEMTEQSINTTNSVNNVNVTKLNISYTTTTTNITESHVNITVSPPTSVTKSTERLDTTSPPTSSNVVTSSAPEITTAQSTTKT